MREPSEVHSTWGPERWSSAFVLIFLIFKLFAATYSVEFFAFVKNPLPAEIGPAMKNIRVVELS
jgi:hypothetical protein